MNVLRGNRVLIQRGPWGYALQVAIVDYESRACAAPIVMEALREGAAITPAFNIDKTQAQHVMDQLWECGLRPSEGTGSAGSLKATERHLEDMRRLVFDDRPTIKGVTK